MKKSIFFGDTDLFSIKGEQVCKEYDDYGNVTVTDDRKYRIMSFYSIYEQTRMRIDTPFLPVHNYIKAMLMGITLSPADSVLILGLGGGSLVRALDHYDPSLKVSVVELRKTVLNVARKYFSLPENNNITYHIDDAEAFISQQSGKSYSHIFSDLYTADAMLPLQENTLFFDSCIRNLRPDGWLILNYHQMPALNSPLFTSLINQFRTVLYCRVPSGNVVLYCSDKTDLADLTVLRKTLSATGTLFSCDFWPLARTLASLKDKVCSKSAI